MNYIDFEQTEKTTFSIHYKCQLFVLQPINNSQLILKCFGYDGTWYIKLLSTNKKLIIREEKKNTIQWRTLRNAFQCISRPLPPISSWEVFTSWINDETQNHDEKWRGRKIRIKMNQCRNSAVVNEYLSNFVAEQHVETHVEAVVFVDKPFEIWLQYTLCGFGSTRYAVKHIMTSTMYACMYVCMYV